MSDDEQTDVDGIEISLFSEEKLEEKPTPEKLNDILEEVKSGAIIILEGGLTPTEESKLVERTMSSIDPDGFTGIEIERRPTEQDTSLFGKLVGNNDPKPGLTVIAPADKMKTLEKNRDVIKTLAKIE